MRVELLRKTSLRNYRMCDQYCLFTTGHSLDEIKRLKESRKIVSFGAGMYSWFCISILKEVGIGPDIITDNGLKNLDVFLDNIPITRPEELLEKKEEHYFIITLDNINFINEIRKQLLLWGVKDFAILILLRVADLDTSNHKNFKNVFLEAYNKIYEDVDFAETNFEGALFTMRFTLLCAYPAAEWVLAEYAGRENISVLDVGPGIGLMSLIYKKMLNVSLHWISLEKPCKVYLVSQQPKLIERNNIDVRYGYIETEIFSGNYDIILFTEIIEHLVFNPVNTLSKLRSMLKPDGRLIITTPKKKGEGLPYFRSWRDLPQLNQDTIKCNVNFLRASETSHVYEYSSEELDEILAESAFEVIHKDIGINWTYICAPK